LKGEGDHQKDIQGAKHSNSSIWEAEKRESRVQSQPELNSKILSQTNKKTKTEKKTKRRRRNISRKKNDMSRR
jgi:hypothetical protein